MNEMKGQAVFAWIFGMVAIFSLAIIYFIFIPTVQVEIGDTIINQSVGLTAESEVKQAIETIKISLPLALLVLVVGVIIYMAASSQKEEPHTDII